MEWPFWRHLEPHPASINHAQKHWFFHLPIEEPIPGEGSAAEEGGEEVIRAEEGCYDYGKHGKGDVFSYVGVAVNDIVVLAEFH